MSTQDHAIRNTLIEHWTDSRRVLVLDGAPDVVDEIARRLAIPPTRLIMLTPQRAVLGLWEDSLRLYVGGAVPRQTNGNRYQWIVRASHNSPIKSCNQLRYNRKSEP